MYINGHVKKFPLNSIKIRSIALKLEDINSMKRYFQNLKLFSMIWIK